MILTKSIKLTYFFGFGILAFLLVVNADAKQADADYFDVGNNNLTVFSVNVFGQGYYDVNFELTGASSLRLTSAQPTAASISAENTFDPQTGLLTLPSVNLKSNGIVVSNYFLELSLVDPEDLVFGLQKAVESTMPAGVSRKQLCGDYGCFGLLTKLEGAVDGDIEKGLGFRPNQISWDRAELDSLVIQQKKEFRSDIERAGHEAALSTVVVFGDWCMPDVNIFPDPVLLKTRAESGFFVSDSLILTTDNALKNMEDLAGQYLSVNVCEDYSEQTGTSAQSGYGPFVQLFDGRWARGEIVWSDKDSGLGAVRLVAETNDRKIPLQDWTPWRGGFDGDQQWLNLKPTTFSEVKTTASVHSPDLARIEGGWFVSIKDASECFANAEGSTLYLDHFSDFGSYGGPIVDSSGAVISIIKNSRADQDGGLCASNKSSTIKNSLGPLSRYYADGSHVTEGIQITSGLISKLKELDPSIGTSSPAPITKDILRPGLAVETAQRFEIPILSLQFTESAYPVAELDAPAIEIAKQATVAFLRETGCATCDENRRTSNFNIGCICTGFAITQTLIVTNDHCVTDLSVGAKTTFLTFYGQEVEAELIGKSSLDGVAELTDAYKEIYGMNGSTGFHRGDVALLRTVQPMLDVQPLKFADSSKLEAWQPLITVGHPAAMTRTGPWVTGVGSFVGGNYFDRTDQAYNLPAAPGASGSPVVNLSGELVGQIAYGGTASGYEKTAILPDKYGLFALELEIDTVGITPAPYSEREDIPISAQSSSGAPSNYIKEMVEKWAPGELPE